MSCPYHEDTALSTNIINLSQLDYIKSKCHVEEGACQLCQELLAAENDVEAAIMQLKAALNRHQRLKTDINRTHSLIIRDLPLEILSRIFYSCFSEDMKQYGEPIYEDSFVPLKVGAVCRTWRQIAWSSPELWTVISMKRLLSPAFHVCKQYGLMEGWIERSGTLPLYVFLEEDVERPGDVKAVPDGCEPCWEGCLQLLKKCCARWEVASLNLSLNSFVYIAHNVKIEPPTRRLALQSPDKKWYHVKDQGDKDALKIWQGSNSNPQQITLNYPIRFGHVSIGWHGVTHVDVHGWPAEECVNLLRHAPCLKSCYFSQVGNILDPGLMEPIHGGQVVPVCHNSLQYLYFECNRSPATFFDQLTLPSLEELEYTCASGALFSVEALRSTFLLEFVTRSCCPLKKLSLIVPPFTPTDYLDTILRLLPLLVHFCLRFSSCISTTEQMNVRDHLLTHLASTASIKDANAADNFLPQLEVLELGYAGGDLELSVWNSILAVFGDPSELGKEGRRPFWSFVINTTKSYPVEGLADGSVDHFMSLQKAGADIDFRIRSAYEYFIFVPVTWT